MDEDPERADEHTDGLMRGLCGWVVAVGFAVLWLMSGCR